MQYGFHGVAYFLYSQNAYNKRYYQRRSWCKGSRTSTNALSVRRIVDSPAGKCENPCQAPLVDKCYTLSIPNPGAAVKRRTHLTGGQADLFEKDVLFIRLRLLGDIVFTIPAIQLFKQRFPGSRLHYVVEERFS